MDFISHQPLQKALPPFRPQILWQKKCICYEVNEKYILPNNIYLQQSFFSITPLSFSCDIVMSEINIRATQNWYFVLI